MKEEASIKEMISILIIILILVGTIIFIIPIFLKQTTKNEDNNNSTEEAKEIPPIKKLRVFFLESNTIKAPIKVEKPAILDKIKAIFVFI